MLYLYYRERIVVPPYRYAADPLCRRPTVTLTLTPNPNSNLNPNHCNSELLFKSKLVQSIVLLKKTLHESRQFEYYK